MPSPEVTIEHSADHVATVELHRPPGNFVDAALVGALADALTEVDRSDARAIVLCSEGKHFSAGADFTGASAAAPLDGDGAREIYAHAARLFDTQLPIIAAVQGAAVGAGAGIALAADLRVATERTRFVFPFARLAIHHGFGISATLPPLVGPSRALDLLLTGRPCGGEEALRIGLCDRLVAAEQLREEAHALAAQSAAGAPLAVRSMRATVRAELAAAVRAATAHEHAAQSVHFTTADHREALRAATAGEAPRFTGS